MSEIAVGDLRPTHPQFAAFVLAQNGLPVELIANLDFGVEDREADAALPIFRAVDQRSGRDHTGGLGQPVPFDDERFGKCPAECGERDTVDRGSTRRHDAHAVGVAHRSVGMNRQCVPHGGRPGEIGGLVLFDQLEHPAGFEPTGKHLGETGNQQERRVEQRMCVEER